MNLTLLSHANWQPGRLMSFSGIDGQTAAADGLVLRAAEKPGWEVVAPGAASIRFLSDTPRNFWTSSDAFRWENEEGFVTCGVMLDAHHVLVKGYTSIAIADDSLQMVCCNEMVLLGVARYFNARYIDLSIQEMMNLRLHWLDHAPFPEEDMSKTSERTAARAYSQLKGQVMSSEGRFANRWVVPARWPLDRMWLWDSAFIALGLRYKDAAVAREVLLTTLQQQNEEGLLPQTVSLEGQSHMTQPPVLTWAVWEVYQTEKDTEWLREIYPLLVRYLEWDRQHRSGDGGWLVEWNLTGDGEEGGCEESGMDNSPRFDKIVQMDAVDFSSYLSRDYECLNFIAKELGKPEEQATWRGWHFQINSMIRNRLWNEERQFFFDYDVEEKQYSPVQAVSGFLPLICGGATQAQAKALVDQLEDPKGFGTPVPLPSVAKREKTFSGDMWRGPMWAHMNWMVAEGLDRYRFTAEAKSLREKTLEVLEKQVEAYGSFFEYYDALGQRGPDDLGRLGILPGKQAPHEQVVREFGCSASVYLDWLWRGFRAGGKVEVADKG